MAPPWNSTPRGGPSSTPPDHPDLISRLHADALDTPTNLRRHLATSSSSKVQVHADSSSSDSDFAPQQAKNHKPKHSRSVSNPFPSLFSSRKKQSSAGGPMIETDMAAGDGGSLYGQGPRRHRRGSPAGSKDFATGSCMTCASLVRWPKDLKVFKCTICMTINDLVPVENEGSRRRRDASQDPSSTSASVSASSKAPMPARAQQLSLEHTKRLVSQCLRTYISNKLYERPVEAQSQSHSAERHFRQDRLHPDLAFRRMDAGSSRQDRRTGNSPERNYESKYVFEDEPTLRPNPLNMNSAITRSYSSSHSERPVLRGPMLNEAPRSHYREASTSRDDDVKRIFKLLEDYIIECFSSIECINSSFMMRQTRPTERSTNDSVRGKPPPARDVRLPSKPKLTTKDSSHHKDAPVCDLDPKLLLLGDFAENGTWWTGKQSEPTPSRSSPSQGEQVSKSHPTTKSPNINWSELEGWYSFIINIAESWFSVYEELLNEPRMKPLTEQHLEDLERELLKAQNHTQRVLLKATEHLLKRPGRPMKNPDDLRFLLVILDNPLLHPNCYPFRGILQPDLIRPLALKRPAAHKNAIPSSGLVSGQHSGIIKRIVGLISNSSMECHNQLVVWLARYQAPRFTQLKDLVSGFLTYRMLRQGEKKQAATAVDVTAGLIPQMQAGRSGAYLHDEIISSSSKKQKEPPKKIIYSDDWQIKAVSRVLALLFSANSQSSSRREDDPSNSNKGYSAVSRNIVRDGSHLLPATDFYNSMIDYADLVADFESWESKRAKFSFCQYPFLLSIWAKTRILEHDAHRQMESKARDAFFDSIMTRRNVSQYLLLDVRRDCLVDDSLNAVSEVIGSGGEDIKKGLRISFRDEEGIDAGGLRKEWFLLLIREVFNPDHGMFAYDEDSQFCYFNPNSLEPSDQFFLVGVVMGLAIYNSTILDVALPPFTFRKLLASAPSPGAGGASTRQRLVMRHTLEDLAEYRPRLAHGLRQLLTYDGDVEATFCLDFVIETERYGTLAPVPLCPGGENKPVTNSNRREYVDLYVRYILDTAVKRQFEPFKRGFYTVCGGNAFSLFRPEEIELLVRGSDEALDISSLRAVAQYDNWATKQPDGSEPIIDWFWETFQQASPGDQRKMLSFITGSDRIPATGAASLPIKISCLGDDCERYPIARTCFNLLSLWQYKSKDKLERMLWRAVLESEGFGLK